MTGLIDIHSHFIPDWYADQARAAGIVDSIDGMPGWPAWSAEAHLALMDEHGIERSMLSLSAPGVHFGDDAAAARLARRTNDFAADLERAVHPDQASGVFALAADPRRGRGAIAEADAARSTWNSRSTWPGSR